MFRQLLSIVAVAFVAVDLTGCAGCDKKKKDDKKPNDKKPNDKKPKNLDEDVLPRDYCKSDKKEVRLVMREEGKEYSLEDGKTSVKRPRTNQGGKMTVPGLVISGVADCTEMEWLWVKGSSGVKDTNAIKCKNDALFTPCQEEKKDSKAK